MRITVAPQHRTFFRREGMITFEKMISPEQLETFKEKLSPNNKELLALIKKMQLAEIAFELTGRKPLRVADVYFGNKVAMEEFDCALLLSCSSGDATYLSKLEYEAAENCLVLIFTPRYLDEAKHPTVYRYV